MKVLKEGVWELNKQLSNCYIEKTENTTTDSHSFFALAALPVTFDEKLLNLPMQINPQDFLLHISEILFHKNLQFQRYSHVLNFSAIRKRKGCVLSNSKREVVLGWMKARTVSCSASTRTCQER